MIDPFKTDPADLKPHLRRDVHIPIYWLVVGIAVMVVSPILSIWVSYSLNMRTIEENEAARQAVRVESAERYCRLLGSQVEVYRDAETIVGREAYNVWLDEYLLQNCKPVR